MGAPLAIPVFTELPSKTRCAWPGSTSQVRNTAAMKRYAANMKRVVDLMRAGGIQRTDIAALLKLSMSATFRYTKDMVIAGVAKEAEFIGRRGLPGWGPVYRFIGNEEAVAALYSKLETGTIRERRPRIDEPIRRSVPGVVQHILVNENYKSPVGAEVKCIRDPLVAALFGTAGTAGQEPEINFEVARAPAHAAPRSGEGHEAASQQLEGMPCNEFST